MQCKQAVIDESGVFVTLFTCKEVKMRVPIKAEQRGGGHVCKERQGGEKEVRLRGRK